MALIFETESYTIEAEDHPLIDRNDGGHITVSPKIRVSERQQLTATLAIELMKLTIVVGEAMMTALNRRGVDIGRINYQDNGNWGVFKPEGPYLHYHLYGRAKSAKIQKYGEACHFPHKNTHPQLYENLKSLDNGDIQEIKKEIIRLLRLKKYKDFNPSLSIDYDIL